MAASQALKRELGRYTGPVVAPPKCSESPPVEPRPQGEVWGELMRAAQIGDRGAYEALLRQIIPFIRARARRLCANPADLEELVQESLVTVHRVRHTYDPGRPFTPWLAAIVQRRSIDALRRRRRAARLEAQLVESGLHAEVSIQTTASPEQEDEAGQRDPDGTGALAKIAELLKRLPPRQRQALELLKLREMTLAEASLMTGQTVGALKVNAHRGLKRLRSLLLADSGGH